MKWTERKNFVQDRLMCQNHFYWEVLSSALVWYAREQLRKLPAKTRGKFISNLSQSFKITRKGDELLKPTLAWNGANWLLRDRITFEVNFKTRFQSLGITANRSIGTEDKVGMKWRWKFFNREIDWIGTWNILMKWWSDDGIDGTL